MPHLQQRQSEIILKDYKTTLSPEKVTAQTAYTSGSNCLVTQVSDNYYLRLNKNQYIECQIHKKQNK